MTDKEMREFDAWIAIKVFKYIPCWGDYWTGACNPGKFNCDLKEATSWAFEYESGGNVCDDSGKTYCGMSMYDFRPTDDPGAAMEVLKRCDEMVFAITIFSHQSEWFVGADDLEKNHVKVKADTLELAICLFAKQLFSTPNPTKV